MEENNFFKTMTASIEQLVDERINQKLRKLKQDLEYRESDDNGSNNNEYLSIEELSRLTGLRKATIYGKRSRREIPAYKFGRELRFKRSEVDTWIRSKKLTRLKSMTADER